MSDLYTSLVRSLLLRYLHDHPVHGRKVWRLRSFSDLPPDVFQQLCELGRIAYEGIVQGQQVIFSDLPSDFDGLGLMQSMNELYVDEGTAVSFSFFHLTLQEYMAALHLSEQPVERQIKHFQEYGHKVRNLSQYDQFIVVLQFLAGLKKFQEYPTDSIRSILTNTRPSDTASEPGTNDSDSDSTSELQITLDGLHWIFESQGTSDTTSEPGSNGSDGEGSASDDSDSELQITLDGLHWIFESQGTSSISEAIGMLTVNPQLRYRRLSAFDCFVLGYCVSHSNCPWDLNLDDCCIGDEEIELMVRGALEGEPSYSGYISALLLDDNQITSSGLNQLGKLQKLLNLYKLDLARNPLGNGGAATLLQSSVAHGLKHLSLWSTGIGAEDCRALGELLSSSPRLEHLNVCGNNLTPEAIQLMFSGLQHNTTLQKLWLNNNPLGSGGVVPLLKSGVAPNLRGLWLGDTGIGEEDCRMLSHLLSSSTRLEELDISDNSLTPMAMEFLVSGLQHNTTLDSLFINGNSLSSGAAVSLLKSPLAHRLCRFRLTVIGEEDSRALGELLSSSQNLVRIWVSASSDGLPPEAVELIITGLQHNTGLELLYMWNVPFSLHNCTSLASVLRHHPLKGLVLYNCSVDADGASELAKTLDGNNTLQTLDLEGTPIDVRGAAAFADILPHNTALKDLLLSDESIGPEGTQLLIDSLTSNTSLLRLTLPAKYESSVSTNTTYRRERGRIRWRQPESESGSGSGSESGSGSGSESEHVSEDESESADED